MKARLYGGGGVDAHPRLKICHRLISLHPKQGLHGFRGLSQLDLVQLCSQGAELYLRRFEPFSEAHI